VQALEEHFLRFPTQTLPTLSTSESLSPALSVQAYYLDSEVWSSQSNPDDSAQVLGLEEVSAALGRQADVDSIKAGYLQTIHVWLPFVSWIRVGRLTLAPQSSMKADIALLLLCMKLVQQVPDRQLDPQSLGLYNLAKKFSRRLELEGTVTLRAV
jgi:hypothetical protein